MMKIGFCSEEIESVNSPEPAYEAPVTVLPRPSLVRVEFPSQDRSFSYYNDKFDLSVGDIVFVEGKLEGVRGRVADVNYNFRIKLSDYKRVTALADTEVHGEFLSCGDFFASFDPAALPAAQVRTWFFSPELSEEEFVSGSDDSQFHITELGPGEFSRSVAERGHDYYMKRQVKYLCINGTKGYAIVEGTKPYEVEFDLSEEAVISKLTCSCYCCGKCKHEFAALLQLREIVSTLGRRYPDELAETHYFSAIFKDEFSEAVLNVHKSFSIAI